MEPHYAVVAFPDLDGADSVEAIRRSLDPLAGLLAAHITLVYPFEDNLGEAWLADHVARAVQGVPPFDIVLTDVSTEAEGYLFLNVGAGADRFRDLHARLYSGPLGRHRSSAHQYRPHVTVGRVLGRDGLEEARQKAHVGLRLPIRGIIAGLAIFRLDRPDRGAVVRRIPLGTGGDEAGFVRGA